MTQKLDQYESSCLNHTPKFGLVYLFIL
uniref:Uncharacterized protein n=1 Tax=Arundo donax TaxID=35708 RepID=A0A0A8YG24_ARUDO